MNYVSVVVRGIGRWGHCIAVQCFICLRRGFGLNPGIQRKTRENIFIGMNPIIEIANKGGYFMFVTLWRKTYNSP